MESVSIIKSRPSFRTEDNELLEALLRCTPPQSSTQQINKLAPINSIG